MLRRPDPAHETALRWAKEDPAKLLAILKSGQVDGETGLAPERAETYLCAYCRDGAVLTEMVLLARGEHQIQVAEEAVGTLLMDGDVAAARVLRDRMPTGEARWRVAGCVLQSETAASGPAKALPSLRDAHKEALARLLPGLEEGSRSYFLEHPGEQPRFEDYAGASQDALQHVVAGYLQSQGGKDPRAALDWLIGLEGTSAGPLLKPSLMAWVQSVTMDYDEATVLAALELADAQGVKAEIRRELMERVSARQPELAESIKKREKK